MSVGLFPGLLELTLLGNPVRRFSATGADKFPDFFCFRVPKSVESGCPKVPVRSGKLSSDGTKDAGEFFARCRRFPGIP